MTVTVERGTSRTEGTTQTLHFVVHLTHPVEDVWPALATADGLRGWLAEAELPQPRLGGSLALRWPTAGEDAHVSTGRITAWDVERVAEYTLTSFPGRIRFHLESDGEQGTTLRFTNEFEGDDALRLDCLAAWHAHFEYLAAALDGRPVDWSAWTPRRFQVLREGYAAGQP
jgi:uncharacterized protein YndB with AHSA1/START domain